MRDLQPVPLFLIPNSLPSRTPTHKSYNFDSHLSSKMEIKDVTIVRLILRSVWSVVVGTYVDKCQGVVCIQLFSDFRALCPGEKCREKHFKDLGRGCVELYLYFVSMLLPFETFNLQTSICRIFIGIPENPIPITSLGSVYFQRLLVLTQWSSSRCPELPASSIVGKKEDY